MTNNTDKLAENVGVYLRVGTSHQGQKLIRQLLEIIAKKDALVEVLSNEVKKHNAGDIGIRYANESLARTKELIELVEGE